MRNNPIITDYPLLFFSDLTQFHAFVAVGYLSFQQVIFLCLLAVYAICYDEIIIRVWQHKAWME